MILLTPGPTPLPPDVREAMSQPIIHHRTPEYQALQKDCDRALQKVFRTAGPVVTLVGSGSAAVEAAQLSLVSPGDTVVSCASGRFGERWQEVYDRIAPRFGITNIKVTAPWGDPIAPALLETTLRKHPDATVVTVVHCETSTATETDIRALVPVMRRHAPKALLVVDGVSSVGAVPLEMDDWDVDVVLSASQKALMMSPGLAFAALGERAVARLEAGATGGVVAPMYLDLREHLKAHEKNLALFTQAVSLMFGLRTALDLALAGGVESAWRRTSRFAQASRTALQRMGLRLMSNAPCDAVTGVFYPDGVGDELRKACEARHGVQFAAGQDAWLGRALRMSHMGFVNADDTLAGLTAIATELKALRPKLGAGADAGLELARGALLAKAKSA